MAPYRGPAAGAAPVRVGDLLASWDLRDELRPPFKELDDEYALMKRTRDGLHVTVRTPQRTRNILFKSYPIANVAVRAWIQCRSTTPCEVALSARRFSVKDITMGYCATVKPNLNQYRFEMFAKDKWHPLTNWESASALERGAVNQYELRAVDDCMALLINDKLVAVHRDRSFGRGYPAVMVVSNEGNEQFVIERVELYTAQFDPAYTGHRL